MWRIEQLSSLSDESLLRSYENEHRRNARSQEYAGAVEAEIAHRINDGSASDGLIPLLNEKPNYHMTQAKLAHRSLMIARLCTLYPRLIEQARAPAALQYLLQAADADAVVTENKPYSTGGWKSAGSSSTSSGKLEPDWCGHMVGITRISEGFQRTVHYKASMPLFDLLEDKLQEFAGMIPGPEAQEEIRSAIQKIAAKREENRVVTREDHRHEDREEYAGDTGYW